MSNFASDTPPSPIPASPALDESVVKRALACYLPTSSGSGDAQPVSLEPTLNHALDFLRCATATVYELGDSLQGSKRDLAFATLHMMEMAKVMVERSLESVERV